MEFVVVYSAGRCTTIPELHTSTGRRRDAMRRLLEMAPRNYLWPCASLRGHDADSQLFAEAGGMGDNEET
jgi:hypothetical protein